MLTQNRNPAVVKKSYTEDSIWRNRDQFLRGHAQIVEFLTRKWEKENGYRLRKELFAFRDNKVRSLFGAFLAIACRVLGPGNAKGCPVEWRLTNRQIAVQFWYEWHDASGQWWRTYGLEDWTFADDGRMRKRQMSGNDVPVRDEERWFADGVDVNEVDISETHW